MEAKWFTQSKGNNVNVVNGYIVRGYHIEKTNQINTLDKAINQVLQIRRNAAKEIKLKRMFNLINKNELKNELKKIWITKQDSISAGNCKHGTQEFINNYVRKHNYGLVGAVRADVLLEEPDNNLFFIKKILKHKLGVNV